MINNSGKKDENIDGNSSTQFLIKQEGKGQHIWSQKKKASRRGKVISQGYTEKKANRIRQSTSIPWRKINASDQDSITELFESSLLDNKTDFVKLIMDRLENFNAFVRRYIPILYEKDRQQNSTIILEKIRDFLRNLFGDSKFQFYEDGKPIAFYEDKRPYHHCFVWAVLLNRKEMATIFWEKDTDYICSALFASAVLKELAKRAYFSNNVELTMSLKEHSRYFENEACTLMTELYESYPERGSDVLVTKVSRYNSTPLAIAHSQKLTKFMANSACQAKLNDIWMGNIAPHTPAWKVVMTVLLPVLIIQKIGFITIENHKSTRIYPSQNATDTDGMTKKNNTDHPDVYLFYNTPIVKFLFYLITYLAFVVIFSIFVLTDLHPLSESSPSVFEYMTWLWTLSLAIEEIRQIGDLAFFFALFALFIFSFGIIYQAILFPNSLSSPWELFKDLIYLPYWQMYGELNIDQIEGKEPSECTSDPVLYTNGTLPRCAQKSQFSSLILATYLVLTNIVLVNLLIAMFSRTFEKVEDNSETIWKFNRYALVYEYFDRPMFPIPIIIHLTRIIVLCYYNLRKRSDDSPFPFGKYGKNMLLFSTC
ncbi:unnamed protein product [Mytilus coruscus]|uniref:TRPM-like domain-containing protein n=1 Tax=Mytilus coruscus TaxID=42192 RepID=A0A6J8B907_MYTCO|nr:unnamed protein product [Mytilus coruscus]